MLPPIFFTPSDSIAGDLIKLPKEEAHHARTVLRLKENSQVIVVDGEGVAYKGTLNETGGRKDTIVSVHNIVRNFGETHVKLTLAAGFSEGYKFDNVVQQGTEIGVSRFIPVITEKSKIKISNQAKAMARIKRLERVALSAMKQCRRSYLPRIDAFRKLSEILENSDKSALNLIFHPDAAGNNFTVKEDSSSIKKVTVLVGPESGFTDAEVEQAVKAGFRTVRMGPRWMRTETAAPMACAVVLYYLGELS